VCDTFARIGPSSTLFAKNSDRPIHESQVVHWHPRRPAGDELRCQYLTIDDAPTLSTVLSQPTWLWGAEHGVNESGVAIGNERVWSARDLQGPPALIGMDLVRLGLERGGSADEALEVITSLVETHGQGGSGHPDRYDPYDSSFLIVDGRGGWVLETSGNDWAVAPIDGAAAISNRYVLGTDWTIASGDSPSGFSTDDWHDPAVDTGSADRRLITTRACIAGDRTTPGAAMAALRDHGDGPSGSTVCMHRADIATTASMVAELPADASDPIRLWCCVGAPCVGDYIAFEFPASAAQMPPALSTLATRFSVPTKAT